MIKMLEGTGSSHIGAVNCVIDHKIKLMQHYKSIGYNEMYIELKKQLGGADETVGVC
ncbi:MAG: hypothetical protein ACREAU_00645 [Nitrosopumilaceae archaeon]